MLRAGVKIVGLVFGIALIVGAWYLGAEWWTRPVNVAPWYVQPRMRPRLEFFGVMGVIGLIQQGKLSGRERLGWAVTARVIASALTNKRKWMNLCCCRAMTSPLLKLIPTPEYLVRAYALPVCRAPS